VGTVESVWLQVYQVRPFFVQEEVEALQDLGTLREQVVTEVVVLEQSTVQQMER
jgi:hypothetical protein